MYSAGCAAGTKMKNTRHDKQQSIQASYGNFHPKKGQQPAKIEYLRLTIFPLLLLVDAILFFISTFFWVEKERQVCISYAELKLQVN